MNEVSQQPRKSSWLSTILNAVVCLAILAASAAAIVVINRTEPTAQQVNGRRTSAALVDTVTVQRGTFSPELVVLGTVQPAQDIVLSPRVRGQVVDLSQKFAPGEVVSEGELLLQIDPADFHNAVSIRQSELQQAQASLEIEEGRQSLARQELALLGDSIEGMNRSLVLREPQYASIQSQIRAANAALERAQLDLERTAIIAPFDAQILRRSANIGSQVGPGDEIGRLVGIDEYWVMAAVPIRSLRWIRFPDDGQEASFVKLRNPDAWGEGTERDARVSRMIGSLDQQTRLARVLVTVKDPLARKIDAPPLILDTLIEVRIEGKPIEDVVQLSRQYVHDRNTVWVMKEGKLEVRATEIVFQDAEHAYIRNGLESGDEVRHPQTLATVAEGIGLRRIGEEPETLPDNASSPEPVQ